MVFILRNGARVAKRAALVTGGSGGIGLAIARRLAESGYAVTISGRREDKLLKAAEGLADDDLKVEAVVADVTSEEAVVELVAEHKRQWGRLDCLVNNAGIGIGQPIYKQSRQRWRNYEKQLEPVMPILEPYIKALGYE